MTKLALIMVMNGARGLLEDLAATYDFSEEDQDRVERAKADLLAEVNKLDIVINENKQMFDLLEMVARGITLDCDTEDVIRITSAVKKFCIAKRESEEK